MVIDLKCIDPLVSHLDTIGRRETHRCKPSLQYWRFNVPSGLRNHVLLLRLDWRIRGSLGCVVQEIHVELKYMPDQSSWFEDGLIDMSWSMCATGLLVVHRHPPQDIKSKSLAEVLLLCRLIESIVLEHLVV